jgi:hypothetical protein
MVFTVSANAPYCKDCKKHLPSNNNVLGTVAGFLLLGLIMNILRFLDKPNALSRAMSDPMVYVSIPLIILLLWAANKLAVRRSATKKTLMKATCVKSSSAVGMQLVRHKRAIYEKFGNSTASDVQYTFANDAYGKAFQAANERTVVGLYS